MKKFTYIEILRLITSLSVLIYHYIHFFHPYNSFYGQEITFNRTELPFYHVLNLFYDHGRYGVEMFWAISGFVFAHVYLDQSKKTSSKEFFINRFARLYPLHLATLILVSFLQILSVNINGTFEIYKINDLYHFFLNLFFVHGWGAANGWSFNAPTWSVSIELIIYSIFFGSIYFLNKFNIKFLIFIYLILLLVDKYWSVKTFYLTAFFDCSRLFFSGVLIHYIFKKIYKKIYLILLSTILIFISLIGSLKIFILFPAIILLLSSFQSIKNIRINNFFQFSGDLTYSLYLLHIPSQIIIIQVFGLFNFNKSLFLSEYFFTIYIIWMLLISSMSFKFFEKPLNKKIRNFFKD
tara:strand:- start:113 stop:1165 length:1053 start_codon:yes stop_codon:yes gene_type:complete